MSRRWPLLLLVLVAAAFGLAACGGGGDDASVDKILADTFGKGKEVKSGRLDLSVKLDAKGLASLAGPIGARLSGPFQSQGSGNLPKFAFDAEIDAGGQSFRAGATSTGDKGYVSFQGQPYVLTDQLFQQFKTGYAQQAKCSTKKDSGGGFAALGIDPRDWLTNAKKEGTEKVGGADTTHISGRVDVPKFLTDVNKVLARTSPQQQSSDPCASSTGTPSSSNRQLTAAQQKTLADAVKNAQVDVWTGSDDRTMRRMNVTLDFTVPQSARQQAGGLTSGKLTFDLSIGDLNKAQTITAPKNAKPFSDLQSQLAGATGGGTSGSGGTSTTPQATGGSKYEQCMNAAGQDVKKLQQCADLIGQ